MYSCKMPVPDQWGPWGAHAPTPHEEDVSVLKKFFFSHYMYGNGLVEFGVLWGGLGYLKRPHDGYANRSNSQTSLPRAIGSPTDSRTVLPRAIG